MCVHVPRHAWGCQRTVDGEGFPSFTMWVLRMEFGSLGLAATPEPQTQPNGPPWACLNLIKSASKLDLTSSLISLVFLGPSFFCTPSFPQPYYAPHI